MGRVAAPWSDGQIYTCSTVLQAAAFPGFLLSGWLVDRLGWFEATVNGSLLAAAAALAAFNWLLTVDPAEGQPTGGLYAGIVAATFACGFSFALFQPAALEMAAAATAPAAEAVSCSLLYLSSQFFGIGFIFVFRALVEPDGSTARVNLAMLAKGGAVIYSFYAVIGCH